MANYSYTSNGIVFTIEGNDVYQFEKLANANSSFKRSDIAALINAVEIDWNGAQVAGKTLNTTGEMLSILQTAYNYATTYNVKYSGGKLYDDKGTEIKVGSDYTLPTASSTVLGGVKVGTGLSISSGVLSVKPEYVTESELAAKSYITTTAADGKYQAKGNYLTAIPSEYVTESELAAKSYITSTAADGKYQAKGNYLTAIPSEYVTESELAAKSYITSTAADGKYQAKGNYLTAIPSEYVTESELAAKSYITTSAANTNYAGKNHQHTEYANAVHEHSNYAIKSHASTATTYGVGTSANYGHLKISGSYATQTTATDIALSLGGAYNMYKAFVTRISELAAEITALKTRVTTLEGYHATKPVTAVTVTPETYTLYGKGDTAQLSCAITPSDASNKTVTWSSSATGIATVSAGKVTTVAKGSATITATANDGSGKKDTCAVTVSEARITAVSASDITATFGGTIAGINATQTVQSGDGAVFTTGFTYTRKSGSSVTVNSTTGALTIASAGTSYITVTSKADTTKTKEVKVTVNKATDTVTIKEGSTAVGTTLSKTYGNSLTLTATTKSGNAVTWDSSDKTVATISTSGAVTILKTGTTTITANVAASTNYNTANDTVTLTVNAASQSITLSPTSLSWGASDALTAKQITVSGHKGTLSVSSSNTNVQASVSGSTVTVTPKAYNQNATITVKAAAVSGKYSETSKTASVTVAAQATKYYWYAGWTEPTAANIATIINETYPSAKGSTTMNPAGKTSTTLAGTVMDFSTNPIYDQEARNAGTPREYYFVLPTGYGIYNPTLQLFWQDEAAFEKVREFTNHKVLRFTEGAAYKIDSWIIKEIQ